MLRITSLLFILFQISTGELLKQRCIEHELKIEKPAIPKILPNLVLKK